MAGPLATVDDVEAVWRPLDADERPQAERLLALASSLVRTRVRSVDDRVATDPAFADVVTTVVAGVVVRVLVNPDGLTQRSEGPFSATFSTGSGRLYLTAEDVAALSPRVALGGVYSVPLS